MNQKIFGGGITAFISIVCFIAAFVLAVFGNFWLHWLLALISFGAAVEYGRIFCQIWTGRRVFRGDL